MTDAHPLRLGIAYDFRLPPGAGFSHADLYAETLEQIRFADQLGYDMVWLSEHHFVPDGYLPSFQPVAGAIAACTSRIRISTDVALAPFHHPIRLAEDMAVLDQLSGGRMELGLGMGYAVHEFNAFGMNRKNRVSLTEEAIEILRQAWSDDAVNFSGKRYQLSNVNVYPKPVQQGGIPLWIAAQSTPGAERAARMGLNFLPQGSRGLVLDPWHRALADHGRNAQQFRVGIMRSWLVTDDRERDWPPIKAGEVYRAKMYRDWNHEAGDNFEAWESDDRIPQTWVIGNEDHLVAELSAFLLEYGITDLVTYVAPPGVRPSAHNESLERFAKNVMPQLRAAVNSARSITNY